MKTKKIVALLLALILALLCFAGCRDKNKDADTPEEPEQTEEVQEEEKVPIGELVEDVDEPLVIDIPEDQAVGGD